MLVRLRELQKIVEEFQVSAMDVVWAKELMSSNSNVRRKFNRSMRKK